MAEAVKAGEPFPSELDADGRPVIPDSAILAVDRAELESWDGTAPLRARVVYWGDGRDKAPPPGDPEGTTP